MLKALQYIDLHWPGWGVGPPQGRGVLKFLARSSGRAGGARGSVRTPLWLKVKNPNARAVKREVEEDWR
jgi:hypothetical protein